MAAGAISRTHRAWHKHLPERRREDRRRRFRPLVSVVIPARNEEGNIAWVLDRLPRDVHEVVIVDGHSTDRTVEEALARRPDAIVVHDNARGKGDALRTGFGACTGHFIVMLDADGSMDPREIPRFVDALVAGSDIVKGSRALPGGGSADLTTVRDAGNRVLCQMVNELYGASFTDLCYGFFALRRACLPQLMLCSDGFEIETEIVVCALKAGLRVTEVPSFELPRRTGMSNLRTFRDGARVMAMLARRRVARLPRPIHNPWATDADGGIFVPVAGAAETRRERQANVM